MLKIAFNYKEKLQKEFAKAYENLERYKYYFADTWTNFNINIADNNWNNLQYVSVYKGNVVGYFNTEIVQHTKNLNNLQIINFLDKPNFVFSKDLLKYFKLIFNVFNLNKVSFCAVVGSPQERMYDKLIKKHNGRIIGVKKKEVMLYDRKLYDLKLYEIFNKKQKEVKL